MFSLTELKITGKPLAGKSARAVWRKVVGKVLPMTGNNSLATHPTPVTTPNTVLFDILEVSLDQENKEILDRLIPLLKNCQDCSIRLEGFADDSGSKELNDKVSQDRVKIVQNYLINMGVTSLSITKEFYGELGEGEDNARKVDIRIYRPPNTNTSIRP